MICHNLNPFCIHAPNIHSYKPKFKYMSFKCARRYTIWFEYQFIAVFIPWSQHGGGKECLFFRMYIWVYFPCHSAYCFPKQLQFPRNSSIAQRGTETYSGKSFEVVDFIFKGPMHVLLWNGYFVFFPLFISNQLPMQPWYSSSLHLIRDTRELAQYFDN